MGVLIISDDLKSEIGRIRSHAEPKQNWYIPGGPIPGNNSKHMGRSGTFRFVFSITYTKDKTYRHLSISTAGTKWPNPLAAFTIAHLFGFTGADVDKHGFVNEPAEGWMINKEDAARAVVVIQRLP